MLTKIRLSIHSSVTVDILQSPLLNGCRENVQSYIPEISINISLFPSYAVLIIFYVSVNTYKYRLHNYFSHSTAVKFEWYDLRSNFFP